MKRIAVVGLGAIGAQVLWQLSRRDDVTVHGYDLHGPGHGFGASGGDGRLFRTVQYEDTGYVPLLKRATQVWSELETETRQRLRAVTGGLIIGDEASAQIRTAVRGVEAFGLDAVVLTAAELRRRFPVQRYRDSDIGVLDRGAGIIRPELTNMATIDAAVRRGASLFKARRVAALEPDHDMVRVVTTDGSEQYDHVVVATGAWIGQLVPQLAGLVQPRKITSAWFFPRDARALADAVGFVRTAPVHYYGVPSADGISIKLGLSGVNHLDVDHPDAADYTVRHENFRPFVDVLSEYFPALWPDPFRVDTYFEGYTADARPVLQNVTSDLPVTILAGFSGHGFKFAPLYGQIGAQLAADGVTDPDIEFLLREFA